MTGYEAVNKIIREVKKVIKGKDEVINQVITAIIADGHILIDDIQINVLPTFHDAAESIGFVFNQNDKKETLLNYD